MRNLRCGKVVREESITMYVIYKLLEIQERLLPAENGKEALNSVDFYTFCQLMA